MPTTTAALGMDGGRLSVAVASGFERSSRVSSGPRGGATGTSLLVGMAEEVAEEGSWARGRGAPAAETWDEGTDGFVAAEPMSETYSARLGSASGIEPMRGGSGSLWRLVTEASGLSGSAGVGATVSLWLGIAGGASERGELSGASSPPRSASASGLFPPGACDFLKWSFVCIGMTAAAGPSRAQHSPKGPSRKFLNLGAIAVATCADKFYEARASAKGAPGRAPFPT